MRTLLDQLLCNLVEFLEEAPDPDQLGIVGPQSFFEHYSEWADRKDKIIIPTLEEFIRAQRP